MKRLYIFLALFSYLLISPAIAERIVGQLPNGVWVNAEYTPAEEGKPTVLLIHPLQQTNQFSTIINLSDSLADDGYGVLTPNLSLGISNRQRSMACEAIHMQSMAQDTEEIDFWADWLADKNMSPIIGMGHSTGALQILTRADTGKFSSILLINLVAIGPDGSASINLEQLEMARQSRDKGLPNSLGHYQYSYCKDYVTSRDTYLDTATWDANKVSQQLSKLNLEIDIILGDEDHSLSHTWLPKTNSPHIHIHYMQGADHFFSGSDEFDLHDKVLEVLGK